MTEVPCFPTHYTGASQNLGWSSAWTGTLLHVSGLSPTGLLVLHWEANGSSSWGFNASVGSARCGSGGPGSCPVPQECVPHDGDAGAGLCRCPQGWAGPHCRMALCPENCNAHNGAGTCNQVQVGQVKPGGTGVVLRIPSEPPSVVPQSLGVCICAEGFGGSDCATKLGGGQLVWETLMDSRLSAVSCGHLLSGEVPHLWDHSLSSTPGTTPQTLYSA